MKSLSDPLTLSPSRAAFGGARAGRARQPVGGVMSGAFPTPLVAEGLHREGLTGELLDRSEVRTGIEQIRDATTAMATGRTLGWACGASDPPRAWATGGTAVVVRTTATVG